MLMRPSLKAAVLALAFVFVAGLTGCGLSSKSSESYTVPDPNSHPPATNAAQQRREGGGRTDPGNAGESRDSSH